MRHMLRRMSARQLLEWEAYSELEPFDKTRVDLGFAQITTALYNIHRDRKAHPSPFKVADFMPKFDEDEAPKRSTEYLAMMLNALAQAYSKDAIDQ